MMLRVRNHKAVMTNGARVIENMQISHDPAIKRLAKSYQAHLQVLDNLFKVANVVVKENDD